MVWQAFIDDSRTPNGILVLAGYIATAEAWARLAKDWEELLPLGTLTKDGKRHFKMSAMAASPERMEKAQAFYRAIERHVQMAVSCTIDVAALRRAKSRVWVPNLHIDWGYFDNPYLVATRFLLDMFHTYRRKIEAFIPLGEKIDFIFDEQSEKASILTEWNNYMARRPEVSREFYGATPRFENDQEFLPLQAADFWAWWVREWFEQDWDSAGEKIDACDFGLWHESRRFPRAVISFNEDQMVAAIISVVREMIEPGRIIYDVRFSGP